MQVSQRRALVQKAQPTLSISRQCELLALNRSSLYYQSQSQRHHQDAPVLERIRRIMVDFPFYGSRKVTETLKQQGLVIGRNRVRRLLCQLNLQALRPKPARGFKSRKAANATLKGFETMRMLKKGQGKAYQIQGGIQGEVRLIERAFGLGPSALTESMEWLKQAITQDPELAQEIEKRYGQTAA